MSHKGMYNGNISWMLTDLAKIGEINNDRTKGMQAMLYGYDQLNRIVQSKSLTDYNATTGFAARASGAMAYDEAYSYDGNGNLLTLRRRDETAALQDNFNYQYYLGTNKLKEVKPNSRDKVVSSGKVITDNILYRNLTLKGSSYVAVGSKVEAKATERVQLSPDFRAAQGADLWAHLVADEGTYQYDAIGNLILDQEEGVQIQWTPYGKIRQVNVKGDSLVIRYRYDAAGDRVEKQVVLESSTKATRYVRDASGNVMGIYQDTTLTEQPLYGSSRLGQYQGGIGVGIRKLGLRNYELSNHLGNVLAVISDNVVRTADGASAKVSSVSDFLPFGSQMKGRTWSDPAANQARYGFNGKEKDAEGMGGGGSTYDYGFRIYNPRIAKFLSVDPLTKSYPELTPYQFASNCPISGVDLDGLEFAWAQDLWDEVKSGYNTTVKVVNETYTKATPSINAVGNGLSNVAHNLAPIRPADENDPQSIDEAFDNLKQLPSNLAKVPEKLQGVYSNGTLIEKVETTVSIAGTIFALSKGKSNNKAGIVQSAFSFKGVNLKRHLARSINQGSTAKKATTVADNTVDLAQDVADVNNGLANRIGNYFDLPTGRRYEVGGDGHLWPVSGPGLTTLSRGAYKALGVMNQFKGLSMQARWILSRMHDVDFKAIREASSVYEKIKKP